MEYLGKFLNQNAYWLDFKTFMAEEFPTEHWTCLIFANNFVSTDYFNHFMMKCVEHNATSVIITGRYAYELLEKTYPLERQTDLFEKAFEVGKTEIVLNQENFTESCYSSFFQNYNPLEPTWENQMIFTDIYYPNRVRSLKKLIKDFNSADDLA